MHLFPPADMDLDHEDHPLAMANLSQHSDHIFMKFVLQQQTDCFIPKPSRKEQVSNQQMAGFKKGIKTEATSYPTLRMKGTLTPSAGVCTSLINLMIVMKFWTLITHLAQKIKSYLKTNKFLCFQCLTHIG